MFTCRWTTRLFALFNKNHVIEPYKLRMRSPSCLKNRFNFPDIKIKRVLSAGLANTAKCSVQPVLLVLAEQEVIFANYHFWTKWFSWLAVWSRNDCCSREQLTEVVQKFVWFVLADFYAKFFKVIASKEWSCVVFVTIIAWWECKENLKPVGPSWIWVLQKQKLHSLHMTQLMIKVWLVPHSNGSCC